MRWNGEMVARTKQVETNFIDKVVTKVLSFCPT